MLAEVISERVLGGVICHGLVERWVMLFASGNAGDVDGHFYKRSVSVI